MKRIDSLVRLEYGEELHTQLGNHAHKAELKSAWLQGMGGATTVTLGFYDTPANQYWWKTFDTPMEITSLTGNLSWVDGEPFWHIHGTFSGADYRTVGGHVKELVVGPTCELHITPLEQPLTRTYDQATGLKLLCPQE